MQNKYFLYLKKSYLGDENNTIVFYTLLNNADMNVLKGIQDFQNIITKVKLTAEIVFDEVAFDLVRNNKLQSLKFLIEDLGFKKLVNLRDKNQCTLLHEAALFSGEELVILLLQHGADPNAQDSEGSTPLHKIAITEGREFLIKTFKAFNANLNIKTYKGLAPVHIAALHQTASLLELKKQGANMRLKTNAGLEYSRLAQMVKNGLMSMNCGLSNPPMRASEEEKLWSDFFLGLLLPEFSSPFFEKNLQNALNVINPSKEFRQKLLLDIYILGCSINSKAIVKFLRKTLQSKKLTSKDVVILSLRLCRYFRVENDYDSFSYLALFTYSMLKDVEKKSMTFSRVLNDLCVFFNELGLYAEVDLVGKKALALLPMQDKNNNSALPHKTNENNNSALKSKTNPQELKAFIHYNMGLSQQKRLLIEDSLENFQKSYELLPSDLEIFHAFLNALLILSQHKRVISVCKSAEHQKEYAQVILLHAKLLAGKINAEHLLNGIKETYSDPYATIYALDIKSQCLIQMGDYTKALEESKKSFAQSAHMKNAEIGFYITKLLRTYLDCGFYTEGQIYLEEQLQKYPRFFEINPLLNCFTAAFYVANHRPQEAVKMIESLITKNINKTALSKLYVSLAIGCINNTLPDYTQARKFFEKAVELNPLTLTTSIYLGLIAVLEKNKDQYEVIKTEYDSDLLVHFSIENNLLREKNFEPELNIEEYDPAKIHAYFQAKKKQELSDFVDSVSKRPETPKWWIDETNYEVEKNSITSLDSKFYPQYYAMINEKKLTLDGETLRRFQMALEKGLCSKKLHSNGVKFLKNCVIELKIDDDTRLYTTHVYRNPQGNFLVLFDRVGNHSIITRVLRNNIPITVINVPSLPSEQFTNNHSSFFNSTGRNDTLTFTTTTSNTPQVQI